MKLQTKLSITIFSLILFFGSIATISTFFLTRRELSKQLTNNIISNSLSQSQEAFVVLNQSKDLSRMLSERPSVREYFTNPSNLSVKKQIENNYLDGFNLGENYSAIYLLDQNGIGKVSTDSRFIGEDYSFREYFKAAKLGKQYFYIAKGITTTELGYYFSSPIFSTKNENEVVGVAILKLIPNYIETAILEHSKSGINIFISDQDGIVIGSTETDKLFRSLGTLQNSKLENLLKNNPYGLTEIKPMSYDILMDYISTTNETVQSYQIIDEADNELEVLVITKIKDFPIYIIHEAKFEEITQLAIRSSSIIAGLVASTAIISIIIIIIILKIILRQQEQNELKIIERTTELEQLNHRMVNRELKMIELKNKIKELEEKK